MIKNNSSFFKVGDKVRILPRRDEWRHQVPFFLDEMETYCGKEFTIEYIDCDGTIRYQRYFWGQDWLEPVYEENDVDIDIDMDAFMSVVCH